MGKKLFKPGQSGNPNGRPKGLPNKDIRKMREWINNYLDNEENQQRFIDALNKLKPRDYIMAIIKLMAFVIPKARHPENEYDGERIDFNIQVIEPKKRN